MYEIYTTPAYILSSVTQGDSDLYVRFYTRDLGFVGAVVSAARKEISKHRYSIQPYSFVSLSLVKGKRGFRVTGLEHQKHLALGKPEFTKKSVTYITKLLLLLIHGQEKDHEFYDLLRVLFDELISTSMSSHEDSVGSDGGPRRTVFEIYMVVRILKHLGYFEDDFIESVPEFLFDEIKPSKEDLRHIQKNKHTYIEYINKCIYESQL